MGNVISLNCGPTCNLSPNVNLGEEIGNILCPRRAAAKLELEMRSLRATKDRVEQRISRHIRNETTGEVWNWIAAVVQRDANVEEILSSSRLRGVLCCCICSKYSLGCDVKRELELVKQLRSEAERWEDDKFMENIPFQHDYVLPERLHGSKIIVGIEETMSRVLDYLKNDGIGVIGIHGMGGAGKTTLINQVIRSLQSSSAEPIIKFDSIIEVVVSQKLDVRKIQDEIAKQLGIDLSRHGDDERDRAGVLSAWLSRKRFLLVLDDVWEAVDLQRIVSNFNNNGCSGKVVLTTREESVCVDMGCQERVKVGCLGKEHSWELFQKTIRRDDNWFQSVVGVREIAEEMVRRCGGLPLLLITVSRAMSTKKTRQEWEDAEKSLEDSPHVIRGMEDVYRWLEFSFNNLKNEEYKSCLLYSALFPEDHQIPIKQMVDYCIGGGSIVGADSSSSSSSSRPDIDRLRRNGRTIILGLIDACLLERMEGDEEKFVKVHDAIRDMILHWLGKHNRRYKILSDAGKGIEGEVEVDETLWRDASILSLQHNKIQEVKIKEDHRNFNIDEILKRHVPMVFLAFNYIREVVLDHENLTKGCNNNMQVLLLNWNRELKKLPRRLFVYFPNLRVLDLSHTGLEEIPASLCSLKSLQYLNLSWTDIKALPKEMGNLTNLMQLDLSYTSWLCEIPSGVLSCLSKLQSMNLIQCGFFSRPVGREKLKVLKEVDGLPLLKDVGHLSFCKDPDAVKFLVGKCKMLSKSITELHISGVDLVSDGLFQRIGIGTENLECLHMDNFLKEDKPEDLVIREGHFMKLKVLEIESAHTPKCIIILNNGRVREQLTLLKIESCNGLSDLACLSQLPKLKELAINKCNGIKEVVPRGDGDESHGINCDHEAFPKLQLISLCSMESLEKITNPRHPLSLRSLTHLKILYCPSLKELSIVPSSSQNVKIHCERKWWKGLKWTNGTPPDYFKPDFFT